MDEENKVVQTTTSPTPETEPIVPEVEENVEGSDTDTQPTSEADVVQEESGEETVDTPVSNWENDKKAMSGKISSLEKERNEYQQKARLLEALDSAAANDPEFMRIANKKLVEQGLLDESVLQEFEQTVPQKTDGTTQNPAILWAQQQMQNEKNKREEFFKSFEERHSDLTEGSPEIVRANRNAIGAAAARIMAKDNVSEGDAYEHAYKLIMNPNQLIEDGKLQGIAQAQSGLPSEGAASGGVAKSSGGVILTPEQKDVAKRFGMTEEKYAQSLEE